MKNALNYPPSPALAKVILPLGLALLGAALAALLAGCGSKEEQKESPPAAKSAPSAMPNLQSAEPAGAQPTLATPAPPGAAPAKPAVAQDDAGGFPKPGSIDEVTGMEAGAALLTELVQEYYNETQGRLPADLNDFVRMQKIRRLPHPPKGKKYVIDREKAVVVLANAP